MNTDGQTGTSPLELATLAKKGNPIDKNKKETSLKRENRIENIEKKLNELKILSPSYQINTRSKSNTEHTQLTFESKPKIKMSQPPTEITLRLEEAFKLIPTCSGETDVYQFINACDIAVNSVDRENVPLLIRYITTKLSGKALDVIKYKDTTKWVNIKKYLSEAFESQYSASSLQLQINSIKMNLGETVNSYTERIEQLYYKLCNIYTFNKPKDEAKIIQTQLKEQTLGLYIKGLIKPIKIVVKSRDPKTLEEAKNIANTEELEFNAEKETRNLLNTNYRNNYNNGSNNIQPQQNNRYRNNYNNNFNKKPIICYKCNGRHFASQCRSQPVQRSNQRIPDNNYNNYNNRPPSNNRNNFNRPNNYQSNNYTRPPTNYNTNNYNTRNITCSYCNKTGHEMSECFKKRNNERNNYNSGNGRSGEARGPRTVNQITAEETYDDVFTLNQQ